MQRLDIFGDDQDDLAFTIYADATELEPDREGRIVLPESLASFANLADNVAFVGMGRLFQIWEPAAAERLVVGDDGRPLGIVLADQPLCRGAGVDEAVGRSEPPAQERRHELRDQIRHRPLH